MHNPGLTVYTVKCRATPKNGTADYGVESHRHVISFGNAHAFLSR
jgi:hypothetical protein